METKLDPHKYEDRYKCTIRGIENSKISTRNKKLIFRFKDDCVRDGLTKARIIKLMDTMKCIAIIFDKDLDKVTKRDVQRFVTYVQENEKFGVWTKAAYKVILKKFYKWLKGNSETYPEEVRWVKTNINKNLIRLPAESGLLTEDDIKLLINNAEHPRDKAFIALLYESGCRVGGLLTLKLKNLTFDEHGVLINVIGKTGSRQVRIISSTQYIATWISNHPLKNDLESPLWVNYGNCNFNKLMTYDAVLRLLQRLFDKCGIKKRFNPHLFRHSRATFLANHLTEFQMNQYFGWVQGSGMPATYVHLSGKETESVLLALNGVKIDKEEKESSLKPIKCPRCDNINSYDAKFCSKCAGILDIETAMKLEEKRLKELETRKEGDDIMNMLIKDPEVRKILIEKIATIGLNK